MQSRYQRYRISGNVSKSSLAKVVDAVQTDGRDKAMLKDSSRRLLEAFRDDQPPCEILIATLDNVPATF
jgi:hypothetical protein